MLHQANDGSSGNIVEFQACLGMNMEKDPIQPFSFASLRHSPLLNPEAGPRTKKLTAKHQCTVLKDLNDACESDCTAEVKDDSVSMMVYDFVLLKWLFKGENIVLRVVKFC